MSGSSLIQWSFIQQKTHLCLQTCSLDKTLNKPSSSWECFNIWQKLGLFVIGVAHISNLPTVLCKIDASGLVGLALWCKDLTHKILIFVKILFNFKKKIAWIKVNLKTLSILPKTKNFNWLHHVTLKI